MKHRLFVLGVDVNYLATDTECHAFDQVTVPAAVVDGRRPAPIRIPGVSR
ncbi:MAG: hypothetical protein ACRDR6_02775 [Pseudonocardiaceae bacterium]